MVEVFREELVGFLEDNFRPAAFEWEAACSALKKAKARDAVGDLARLVFPLANDEVKRCECVPSEFNPPFLIGARLGKGPGWRRLG